MLHLGYMKLIVQLQPDVLPPLSSDDESLQNDNTSGFSHPSLTCCDAAPCQNEAILETKTRRLLKNHY